MELLGFLEAVAASLIAAAVYDGIKEALKLLMRSGNDN